MKVNIDVKLIKEMLNGVIFLDRAGHILDFNSAARPYLKSCFNSANYLAREIEKCLANGNEGPVVVSFTDNAQGAQSPIGINLCINEKKGAVIFVTHQIGNEFSNVLASTPTTTTALDLIGNEMRHQMTDLLERLGSIDIKRPNQEFTFLTSAIERMSRHLVAMDQLSMLYRGESFQREEKIQFLDMIDEVLVALPEQRCDYAINRALSDKKGRLGVLYGNPELLKSGLRSLFQRMGDSSPPRCQVELRLRQSGNHLVLTGGFMTSRMERLSTVQKVSSSKESRHAAERQADLRLPISRRILEMHGGKLKVSEVNNEEQGNADKQIESFTLTLPTGLPYLGKRSSACEDCPITRQTEAYARDLVSLMPDNHKASELTQQELAYLQSVMSASKDPQI